VKGAYSILCKYVPFAQAPKPPKPHQKIRYFVQAKKKHDGAHQIFQSRRYNITKGAWLMHESKAVFTPFVNFECKVSLGVPIRNDLAPDSMF
jgi:hypothetical protein